MVFQYLFGFGKKATQECPCGHLGDGSERCSCTPDQVRRYRGRVSGALLDRVDLLVEVPPVAQRHLNAPPPASARACESARVRARVVHARRRQLDRAGCPNQHLGPKDLERHCRLRAVDVRLLATASERLHLSVRARHRVLRVARTIADLADADAIGSAHLSEALHFRNVDSPS